jgi:tetratricopeptide (TPR) repeat protein
MALTRAARGGLFVLAVVAIAVLVVWLYSGKPGAVRRSDVEQNDVHSEIASLEKMWTEHPNHAPIALQLGNLYSDHNEPEKAIYYYREFLKLDTSATGWEVRLDIAKSLYSIGKTADARTELQWILDRDPQHAAALYNMGALEANTGHPDRARTYWQQLISAHPKDSLARFARESLKQFK